MSEVIREVIKEISRASRQACVPDERGHQGEQGEAIRGAIREVIREVIKESKERQSEQSRPVRSNQKQSEAIRGNQRHSEALRGTQRHSEAIIANRRQSRTACLSCSSSWLARE
jgi:hypothetical protein